ncbi:MAG: hypothetical protein ABSH50_13265 [Bryobacteraceae bacterium]
MLTQPKLRRLAAALALILFPSVPSAAAVASTVSFANSRQVQLTEVSLPAAGGPPEIHCYRRVAGIPEITPRSVSVDRAGASATISFDTEETGFCAAYAFVNPSATGRSVTVKDFGAVGDGAADDYDAMRRAAEYICSHGGTLVYPPGDYRIDRYILGGGPAKNQTGNIEYRGCKSVAILGFGATIDIKGDFNRGADYRAGGYTYSYTNAVTPFDMIDATDFRIEGFEINGNVDKMTRDPNVVESAAHGVRTSNCSRYILRKLHVHHCQTDGIYLGGSTAAADRDAVVSEVVSTNNARQGLTVAQVRGGIVVDSVFRETGATGGRYGYHAPAAGVDVEPNVSPPAVDLRTGEILFVRDHFEENLGWQFVADTGPESVMVMGCSVRATGSAASGGRNGFAYLNAAATAVTEASLFDITNGSVIYLHTLARDRYKDVRSVTYTRNAIQMSDAHSVTAWPGVPLNVRFLDNSVNVRAAAPDSSAILLRFIAESSGNVFFFSGDGYAGGVNGQLAVSHQGTSMVRGNHYRTDVVPGNRYFFVDYRQVASVRGEIFESGAGFRPGPNSTFDTSQPFSQ